MTEKIACLIGVEPTAFRLGVLRGCKSIFFDVKNVKKRAFCALFCVYFKRFYSKFQIFFVFCNNFYLKFILFLYFFWLENDLIFIEKKPYPFVRVPIFICIYYSRLFKLWQSVLWGLQPFYLQKFATLFFSFRYVIVAQFSHKSMAFLKLALKQIIAKYYMSQVMKIAWLFFIILTH